MWYILIFLALVVLDQLTKGLVDAVFAVGQRQSIIEGFLTITKSRNSGMAWSFLSDAEWAQTVFLIVTVLAIVFALAVLILKKTKGKWLITTIVILLGGAVGNFIDRLAFREVRDFMLFEWFGFNCNVADVAITVGAVMLIAYFLFFSEDALIKIKGKKDANASN